MPTDVRKVSLRIPKDSYWNAKDAYRIPRDSYPKIAQKRLPNRSQNGSKMAPKWCQHGCQMGPGGVLEASWRRVGAIKKAWSAKGGLPGAYGALLEASWGALGGVLERSWTVLEAPWTAKGRPKEAQEAPKWRYRGLLNRKSLI